MELDITMAAMAFAKHHTTGQKIGISHTFSSATHSGDLPRRAPSTESADDDDDDASHRAQQSE